ncbi:MAG TPA: M48 family metallopeptidase [Noviherbaspirillum sp.]
MNKITGTLASIAASLLLAAPVFAADQVGGIEVEKMSRLRQLVPEAELEQAALQQYTSLKQQAGEKGALLPDNHPQVQRLRAMAKKIIPHAQRWNDNAARWNWEISVISTSDINAFCMPGGKIVFFTGILAQLKLTDDEAAVVMGHEIAHALREHGRERLAKSTLTNAGSRLLGFGLSAILGIDPSVTDAAAGAGANLAILRFSRQDETEADLVGLDIVARAGYDPRAGIALWEKMARVSKDTGLQWLSTHPAGKTRIAEMRTALPKVMPLYAQAVGKSLKALPPYTSNVKGVGPVR